MADRPLMPKATAVWLVDNTKLTFEQIAEFCNLHPLEVKGIADGDVAQGIKGLDPVAIGQLTREQIEAAEANPNLKLKMVVSKHIPPVKKTSGKGPRYTPVSRRQDRPDAIYWLIRNHPELSDATISKLVGTTKSTIEAVRSRTHWNASNLKAVDPVSLALCSQIDLDMAVQRAADVKARSEKKAARLAKRATLRPVSETVRHADEAAAEPQPEPESAPEPANDESAEPAPANDAGGEEETT